MPHVDYSLIASRDAVSIVPVSLPSAMRGFREGGGDHLSDVELLAEIVGPGRGPTAQAAARRVLKEGGLGVLSQDPKHARFWRELYPAQAMRLGVAVELWRRLGVQGTGTGMGLRSPVDVFEATADLRLLSKEHFVGLYLNTRNRLLARETISVGSLNVSVVHPREVFQPALQHSAASMIVVHNHPSGETDPSDDDIAISRRLVEAGDLLGIAVLDHVIVGRSGYTSLKERQLL